MYVFNYVYYLFLYIIINNIISILKFDRPKLIIIKLLNINLTIQNIKYNNLQTFQNYYLYFIFYII